LGADEKIQMQSAVRCRLCDGEVHPQFSIRVLAKHTVEYSLCVICGSLQTEAPYWLKEAYQHNLAMLDTGAAQRNLANLSAAYVVARLFRLTDLLDFGGGDGLLCRLLRDYGLNCYLEDKYAQASYALGFVQQNFAAPELLLAFEVMEHFASPRVDLETLFGNKPKVLLVSTVSYAMQGADWWYLAPETGQHIFFYSRAAMQLIGKTWGYDVMGQGYYWLFLRADSAGAVKKMLARILLTRPVLRLVGALLRLLPTPAVTRDFDSLRAGKS
jgi:hypothetical protein